MIKHIGRPRKDENHEVFSNYINLVEGEEFLKVLIQSSSKTPVFLEDLTPAQWDHRYAEDKWSIKELILHIVDTERIFAYRALRISRNDKTPMAGFNQDDYIPFADLDSRSPASIIEEYKAVRHATIMLFIHFTPEMYLRMGTASDNPFSVLAIGFIIAGHELHHLAVLKEKYL